MYRPVECNVPNAFFEGINTLYNYKPPLENNFSTFFNHTNLPPLRSATKGLNIPFAVREGGGICDLEIGYDHAAYGLISGYIGSGKTTLLHMLITSAVMHYAPSELELWLADYKETEFSFYINNCPPHVRFILADKSSEISYSLIDEIEAELARRTALFFQRCADYREYRALGYELPRLLIVVDEFHRLSQAAVENAEYKIKLENIISEARSAGIVLLFCDQMVSDGLKGLSDKAKRMMAVRIAMRNEPSEVKETLNIPSASMTEELNKRITEAASSVEGGLIYKFEQKVASGGTALQNEVVYESARAIYCNTSDRVAAIAAVCARDGQTKHEQTFFCGAKRMPMDLDIIKRFEAASPPTTDEGDRFYIGTPLGLKPCQYFNLHNDLGENILLAGSDMDTRLALIRASAHCAVRYGYRVVLLVARNESLFRKNKEFFTAFPNATVYTKFADICKFIGESANALDAMDTDDDFDEPDETDKTFVIAVGLNEIYAQMDASTLTQRAAWTVSAPAPVQSSNNDAFNRLTERLDQTKPKPTPVPGETETEPTVTSNTVASIEAKMKALGLFTDTDDTVTKTIPPLYAGESGGEISGYNATQDLGKLIANGWKLGIHTMVVLGGTASLKGMRTVKLEGNFHHRIALRMPTEESALMFSRNKVMRSIIESGDTISAVYESMGGKETCFRPYLLP